MDSVKVKLKEKYSDKAAAYLDAVKKAYPTTVKPSDYMDIDFVFRSSVIEQANQKSGHGAAPVYVYLFTWQSPRYSILHLRRFTASIFHLFSIMLIDVKK